MKSIKQKCLACLQLLNNKAVMHLQRLKLERLLQSVSNKPTATGKALQPHSGSCVSRDNVSYTLENTTVPLEKILNSNRRMPNFLQQRLQTFV